MAKKNQYPRYNKMVHQLLEALYNTEASNLDDCYTSWSYDKQHAYDYCLSDYRENDGYRFRIISHNGWCFRCAYLYDEIDDYTGEILRTFLVVHSRPPKHSSFTTKKDVYDVTGYYTMYTDYEMYQSGEHICPQMRQ